MVRPQISDDTRETVHTHAERHLNIDPAKLDFEDLVQFLLNTIESLEETVAELEARDDEIREERTNMVDHLDDLKDERRELQARVDELETENADLKAENAELKAKNAGAPTGIKSTGTDAPSVESLLSRSPPNSVNDPTNRH